MRVLPGMETWTGLQTWHPAESHPTGVCLPASGLSYCPESLGRASNSVLADFFCLLGNSLEQAVVTRGNAPPESAGPGLSQGVAVCSLGPLHLLQDVTAPSWVHR